MMGCTPGREENLEKEDRGGNVPKLGQGAMEGGGGGGGEEEEEEEEEEEVKFVDTK
jgi:hypothetical protein